MNFPSTEFNDAIASLCFGTASDADVADLHAALRSNRAAQDDYLWQVELHSHLAQMAGVPTTFETSLANRDLQPIIPSAPPARTNSRRNWALVAAMLIIVAGSIYSIIRSSNQPEKQLAATHPIPTSNPVAPQSTGGAQMEGIYRETVRFAIAANAPVIVGTGRAEPIALAAEVPYSQSGDTLHIWDWSKSPLSRVMKDVRLWPHDVFAVSPDGKTLIWASGRTLNLNTGETSQINLGGVFYSDEVGGNLQRILQLQFTPDGHHLALRLSNITLARSTDPLRKEDFSTSQSIQIITWPAGKLVCEFPAGLAVAFSQDAKRAATSIPHYHPKQQIVEHDATTGQILRSYEPHMQEFAYVIAYSPDATQLAAFDSAGELLLWNVATGDLLRRIHLKGDAPADLRFSPDGKRLAISFINKTYAINVASGAIIATFPQQIPGIIRWSPNNQSLDLISNINSVTLSGNETLYNDFPAIKRWKIDDFQKK
jgi:WD40 repeat protein